MVEQFLKGEFQVQSIKYIIIKKYRKHCGVFLKWKSIKKSTAFFNAALRSTENQTPMDIRINKPT